MAGRDGTRFALKWAQLVCKHQAIAPPQGIASTTQQQ
jgi:hypothetical protein